MFFRMIQGNLSTPEDVVVELIDFYLMDIGSSSFTSFTWGPEVTDYFEKNPELLIMDGVRTGCLHSHHTMPTFFSGEDMDDLVINTRSPEVDYYMSVIINTHGEWKSRIAFRIKESVTQQVKSTFANTLPNYQNWKTNRKTAFEETVLYMLNMEIVDEGLGEDGKALVDRFQELTNRKKTKEEEERLERLKHIPSGSQASLFPKDKPAVEQSAEDIERQNDVLMGKLMAASMTWEGGLDSAIQAFRKKTTSQEGRVYPFTVSIHADAVCENATNVIATFEGNMVSLNYTLDILSDLYDTLVEEYLQDGNGTAETQPDDDPIDLFLSALDKNMEKMDVNGHLQDPVEVEQEVSEQEKQEFNYNSTENRNGKSGQSRFSKN